MGQSFHRTNCFCICRVFLGEGANAADAFQAAAPSTAARALANGKRTVAPHRTDGMRFCFAQLYNVGRETPHRFAKKAAVTKTVWSAGEASEFGSGFGFMRITLTNNEFAIC